MAKISLKHDYDIRELRAVAITTLLIHTVSDYVQIHNYAKGKLQDVARTLKGKESRKQRTLLRELWVDLTVTESGKVEGLFLDLGTLCFSEGEPHAVCSVNPIYSLCISKSDFSALTLKFRHIWGDRGQGATSIVCGDSYNRKIHNFCI